MSWRDQAACLPEDPELFFPVSTTGPSAGQLVAAKLVCSRCAVRKTCLDWAVAAGVDHGVWGGQSENERRALSRRTAWRRRQAAAPITVRLTAPATDTVR